MRLGASGQLVHLDADLAAKLAISRRSVRYTANIERHLLCPTLDRRVFATHPSAGAIMNSPNTENWFWTFDLQA